MFFSFGSPAGGRSLRSITALPSPETPSLSLARTCLIEGFFDRICAMASINSSLLPRFSTPRGCATFSSMKICRHPLFVPKGKNFGSAPYIGIPSLIASSFSRLVVLKGTRCARSGSMINERMRSISRGRSSNLSLNARTEPSRGEIRKSRWRA